MSTIGDRIKQLREKYGYSQTDFADKIGVSKQTLYKYENGIVTNIPSDKIEAIATLCKASPSWVMGWESDRPAYYSDQGTADLAQAIYDSRELRLLFDAAKDAKAEDLEFTYEMLMRLKKKEDHDDDDAC